jgi:N-acylglucosamine-6-phosphate 2-epimerase
MLERMKGGLIVSCQALENEPLHGSIHMEAMARAALEGGAAGIRANGYEDIRAIKASVNLPIIGIRKVRYPGFEAFITPTKDDAKLVHEAGADIIALDATNQSRPEELPSLIRYIKDELKCLVMADISTLEEGIQAQQLGCDLVGTTLSGYTAETKHHMGPDFKLLKQLVEHLQVPIVAEGKIETPEEAKHALELGAYFVVIGGAITRPQEITKRFVRGIES